MPSVADHFYKQSAVIPYRVKSGAVEIMLITSRRSKRWVIPKGVKEPGLSAAESARKEALEEAGIEGRIEAETLGRYEYAKWGGVCTVEVFVMQVETEHQRWPEQHRRREWLSAEQAAQRVREPALSAMIRSLPARLVSGLSGVGDAGGQQGG